MSKILVDTIDTRSGTTTLTLGSSNAGTIALGSGDVQSNFLQPSFLAYLSSDQTGVAHESYVKVNFNAESFDTNSAFDTSNYRFTPGVAGKYFLFTHVNIEATNTANNYTSRKVQAAIYKNGSILTNPGLEYRLRGNDNGGNEDAEFDQVMAIISGIVTSDADDYFEVYGYSGNDQGSTDRKYTADLCYFGGYRIGS